MTAAHEAESTRPDVIDQDMLIAATKKIEAAAREHPGWSSVEATIADRKLKAPKDATDKVSRNGNASHEHMYPSSRREAELQYHARASAQARQLTHYAPPENLVKLHEQVTARSRGAAAGRGYRSDNPTLGRSSNVVANAAS